MFGKTHPLHCLPHFIVANTVKGCGIINEAHIYRHIWVLHFPMMFLMLTMWSFVPHPSLKPACVMDISWSSFCFILFRMILSMTLLACRNQTDSTVVTALLQGFPFLEVEWLQLYTSLSATPHPSKLTCISAIKHLCLLLSLSIILLEYHRFRVTSHYNNNNNISAFIHALWVADPSKRATGQICSQALKSGAKVTSMLCVTDNNSSDVALSLLLTSAVEVLPFHYLGRKSAVDLECQIALCCTQPI